MALLAKAGSNGSTLLLDDGSLVCNGLGGAHIADELLDWMRSAGAQRHRAQKATYGSSLCRYCAVGGGQWQGGHAPEGVAEGREEAGSVLAGGQGGGCM